MKSLLAIVLILGVQTAHACPDFTGKYTMNTQAGLTQNLTIIQKGCESLKIRTAWVDPQTHLSLSQIQSIQIDGQFHTDPNVSTVSTEYSFDDFGVLSEQITAQGSLNGVTQWTLDENQNIQVSVGVIDPQSGVILSYSLQTVYQHQ